MKKKISFIMIILCSIAAFAACTTDASAFNRYKPKSSNIWLFTTDNDADGNAVNGNKKVSLASAFKGGIKKPSGATTDVFVDDISLGNDDRIYFIARYYMGNSTESDNFTGDTYACSIKLKGGGFKSHYVQKRDVGRDLFAGLNIIGVIDGNLVLNISNWNSNLSQRSNTVKILDTHDKNKKLFSYEFDNVSKVLTSMDAKVRGQTIAFGCQKAFSGSVDFASYYKYDLYTIKKSEAGFTMQSEIDVDKGQMSSIDIFDEYAIFNMTEGSMLINVQTGEKIHDTAADGIMSSKKAEFNNLLKGLQKYEIVHDDKISITRKTDGKNISFTFEELKEANEFIKILDETRVFPMGTECVGANIGGVAQLKDNIYLILKRNLGELNSYVCRVNFDKSVVDYIGKIKASNLDQMAIIDGKMAVYGDGRIA